MSTPKKKRKPSGADAAMATVQDLAARIPLPGARPATPMVTPGRPTVGTIPPRPVVTVTQPMTPVGQAPQRPMSPELQGYDKRIDAVNSGADDLLAAIARLTPEQLRAIRTKNSRTATVKK